MKFSQAVVAEAKSQGIDAQELKERYENAAVLLGILRNALTTTLESAILRDEDSNLYACPNHTHKLADNAGYRRALRYAISLTNP